MTPECKEIDAIWKQSEQVVTKELIKKKTSMRNAYWGRMKEGGSFPMRSGTTIKGNKLGRVHISNQYGWHAMEQGTYATTKMCEAKVPEIIQHGFDEYYFSPIQRQLRTDWICINELAVREMPEDELAHLFEGMQDASRYLWDEAGRSRYLDFCDNKLLGYVSDAELAANGFPTKTTPDSIKDEAWIFERRLTEFGSDGEMDERYVRVNVAPDKIANITGLSLDMLDEAKDALQYEEGSMYALNEGVELFDVLLADPRTAKIMGAAENIDMDHAMAYGGYPAELLKRTLGTTYVARSCYSVRSDLHGPRFYPDTDFNNSILPSFGAYSSTDPRTWPRFIRVFAYIPVAASGAGIRFDVNKDYLKAPFGISTIFNPRVVTQLDYPETAGIGQAKKVSPLGYGGTAHWMNPPWQCNEDQEMGFFKMRFGTAYKPQHTEEGYAFFHRIDGNVSLIPTNSAIRTRAVSDDLLPYSYQGTAGDPTNEIVGENRPVAYSPLF